MSSRLSQWILAGVAFAVLSAEVSAVMPEVEGFRIDNVVYSGKEKQPVVRTTTIFLNGVVYDFMEQPHEAIVLEPEVGRFTLLSMTRRIRVELSVDDVVELSRGVRQRAAMHESPFVQFLANPEFDERFDLSSGTLTLDSPWITYQVETVNPEDPAIAEGYREFADLYCQVNTMLNPARALPFARMQLNAVLAEHGAIPASIHLTLRPRRSFPPSRVTLRSEHDLARSVGQLDFDRVAQAREFMNIFKLVSFEEYRRDESP